MQVLGSQVTGLIVGAPAPVAVTVLPGLERRLLLTIWAQLAGGDVIGVPTLGGKSLAVVTDGTDLAESTVAARLVRMYSLREASYPPNGLQSLVIGFGGFPPTSLSMQVIQLGYVSQAANVRDVAVASSVVVTHTTLSATLAAGEYTDGVFCAGIKSSTSSVFNFQISAAPTVLDEDTSFQGGFRTMGARRAAVIPLGTVACAATFLAVSQSQLVCARVASAISALGSAELLDEG